MTLPPKEVYSPKNWKRVLIDFSIVLGGAALIVLLDQWTKTLVRENIPFSHAWLPDSLEWLSPYARIVNWNNTGAAFGLFQDSNTFFMILAIVAGILILFYFPQVDRADWPLRFAMVFQLGGAFGNLVDRIRFGSVTDFLSVMDFPVFNVADSAITIGVSVLVIAMLFQELKQRKQKEEEAPGEIPSSPEVENQ